MFQVLNNECYKYDQGKTNETVVFVFSSFDVWQRFSAALYSS